MRKKKRTNIRHFPWCDQKMIIFKFFFFALVHSLSFCLVDSLERRWVEKRTSKRTMKRKGRKMIVVASIIDEIKERNGEWKNKMKKKRSWINILPLLSRLCAWFVSFALWIQNIRKNYFGSLNILNGNCLLLFRK